MLEFEVFIFEFLAIDGLAARALHRNPASQQPGP